MSDIFIFAGPSIHSIDRQTPGMRFMPPASQGDVIRCLATDPKAIAIIDGYFGMRLSVHQKEILEALEQGVPVYGAASMGALRAAELTDFGMVGVGGIFAEYHAGTLNADADVAVTHAPEELGFTATTIAAVDFRATISAARGSFDKADLDHLLDISEGLHFSKRDLATIARLSMPLTFDFAKFFRSHFISRKRDDALELLDILQKGRLSEPVNVPTSPRSKEYKKIRDRALLSTASKLT